MWIYFKIFVEKYKVEYQKKKKKKSRPLFSDFLGRSEKDKQTSFFSLSIFHRCNILHKCFMVAHNLL